jgi:hypothetical protein
MSIKTDNASLAAKAISVDNLDYIKTYSDMGRVVTVVEVDSIGSMLNTLDDLLVNLKVVDDVLCNKGLTRDEEIE